ncbi:MAG: hypothetical protein KY468_05885 [Armatimonadetes bacterium]|nr:hypothetical protein [Armatimonadota bacterium]
MGKDPIVDEVRAIREAYAQEFHFDFQAIWQDLKEKEKKMGRKTVTLPHRKAREILSTKG